MSAFEFTLITLSTLYAGYVITSSSGPWNVFPYIRKRLPLGGLTSCVKCLLPYVALGMIGVWEAGVYVVVWALAASGAGLVLMYYAGMLYGNGDDVHD